MRESTAHAAGYSSVAELTEHVTRERAEQGLPPTIEEPTVLQQIADLLRSATPPPPPRGKRRRRRADDAA